MLDYSQLRRLFRGSNFMTPIVLETKQVGKLAYELSEGEGFNRNKIFGVAVRTIQGEHQEGKLCDDIEEARRFIETLDLSH